MWSPRNFDRKDHGEVPLVTAMAKSYNQATARLGDSVGLDSVIETLKEMGQQRELLAVPSLFIGTTQLAPVEVASLYQTIATNGFRTPLKAIRSVLDKDGQPSAMAASMFKTPSQGATTTLWAATSPQLDNMGGVYCENCDVAAMQQDGSGARYMGVAPWAVDTEQAERLWTLSEKAIV